MNVNPLSVNRELVARTIDNVLQAVVRVFDHHFGGRWAYLKVAIATVLVSLLSSFPAYQNMGAEALQPKNAVLNIKVRHPLAPIPSELKDVRHFGGYGSHNDKLELRLTIPTLGWLTGTGRWTVVVWNHMAALGVFYLLAVLAGKALDDRVGGGLFVLGLGPTFFGAWFFNDMYIGDGIAFFFLLLSIASGNFLLSACGFLAAAFCDERCLTAIPLLFLYLLVSLRNDTEKPVRIKRCLAIAAGAGAWLILRIWIANAFHLSTGTSLLASREILRTNLGPIFPGSLLGVFRASWALPLFALLSLLTSRKWAASLAFAGAFALAAAPAFLVADFDRSLCYTFIVLLVSIPFIRDTRGASRKYLAAILLVNILLISPGTSILRIGAWIFHG